MGKSRRGVRSFSAADSPHNHAFVVDRRQIGRTAEFALTHARNILTFFVSSGKRLISVPSFRFEFIVSRE